MTTKTPVVYKATPLAVEPPSAKFAIGQEAALRETLARFDRAADLVPIDAPGDVEMQPDGTIGNSGLRPTTWCFYQTCATLCSGLYQTLMDLSSCGSEASRLASIGIFNQVVRLKFAAKFHGWRFLCDRHSKTIEAVVGRKYQALPNLQLFDHVHSRMTSLPAEARFFEANLNGRWFLLRYYHVKPVFTTSWDGLNYHAGYHFSNHEGRKASLHVSNLLIRGHDRLAMMLPLTRDRTVRHTGAKVTDRFLEMVSRAGEYVWPEEATVDGLRKLANHPLGLGELNAHAESSRRQKLASQLHTYSEIPTAICARIVADALLHPYNETRPRPSISVDRRYLSERNAMDLAAAACRYARQKCDIAMRERLEQMAYRLLIGRFKYPSAGGA